MIRLDPFDYRAEQCLISCMLYDNSKIDVSITPDEFYSKEHAELYKNIVRLHVTGSEVNLVTLVAQGQTEGLITDVMCHMVWDYDAYRKIISDHYKRRIGIGLCDRMSEAFYQEQYEPDVLISKAIDRLNKIVEIKTGGETDGVQWYNKDDLINRGNDKVNNTFGYAYNDLVVVVAEPGMGKTEWTCHIANTNGRQGKKVLYYSLELPAHKLKQRSSYAKVGLSKEQFQTGKYNDYQKEKIQENYKEFDKWFDITGNFKMQDIDVLLLDIDNKAKDGYQLFIIDNLGKVKRDGHSELEKDMRITSELQNLKNKHKHITIILVHHQGKVKDRSSQGMASVRGSQKIGDNATIMIQLSRDKDPENDQLAKAEVHLLQFKDTEGGVIANTTIYFQKGTYNDEYSTNN